MKNCAIMKFESSPTIAEPENGSFQSVNNTTMISPESAPKRYAAISIIANEKSSCKNGAAGKMGNCRKDIPKASATNVAISAIFFAVNASLSISLKLFVFFSSIIKPLRLKVKSQLKFAPSEIGRGDQLNQ